jgi:hypothetical protein
VPARSASDAQHALQALRGRHAEIPVVLGGIAAGGAIPSEHAGMRVLERIDESVQAVEELLEARQAAGSR